MSRKKKHDHVNHERWLVSYADFITLLFAFFVVLFSSSQADKKKVQQVEYAIHSAFQTMGIFPMMSSSPNLQSVGGAPNTATVMMGDDLDASPKTMADLNKMKAQLDHLLAAEIAHRTVTVQVGRDGLVISLRAAGFFESASAVPIPDSLHTLHAIGNALAATPYDVRIEGHTDNVPIHNGQYQSNWELSTTRATELAQLFIESSHVIPSHLSAAGYAEYHPVASNATEAGRSRNRRVDIIVLPHVSHHEELFLGKIANKKIATSLGTQASPARAISAVPAMPASRVESTIIHQPAARNATTPKPIAAVIARNIPVSAIGSQSQLLNALHALQARIQHASSKGSKTSVTITQSSNR